MDVRPLTTLRRAHWRDAELLAEMRVRSHVERHPDADAAAARRFRTACAAFFTQELARPDGFLRAWLSFAGTRAVGTASLTLGPTLPRIDGRRSLDGRLRNVFVEADVRRQGVATALVRAVIAEAAREGVDRLTLGASAAGRPLYERLGFVLKDDEMVFDAPAPLG